VGGATGRGDEEADVYGEGEEEDEEAEEHGEEETDE
jgi:hypothetical protein